MNHHPTTQPRAAGTILAAALCATASLASLASAATIALASPTTAWHAVSYSGIYPDYITDQQTGQAEGDIVGNAQHPAFYTQFDNGGTPTLADDWLAFRVRLGGNKPPPEFTSFAHVGFDANLDGALDLFASVGREGSKDILTLCWPGTGANVSPSTTSIVSKTPINQYAATTTNYRWEAITLALDPTATNLDLDGTGDTDYFLSWQIPFEAAVTALQSKGISITESTHLGLVLATSTQPNSLNQDLNGPNGGTNSSSTWATLGAISTPVGANGVVPEPAVAGLLLLAAAGLLRRRRRA
ncbi:MAG: PEP-CTERM sorting domain-containing protein [Lentisphaeria bacterium]|jgi:hypothetical protein